MSCNPTGKLDEKPAGIVMAGKPAATGRAAAVAVALYRRRVAARLAAVAALADAVGQGVEVGDARRHRGREPLARRAVEAQRLWPPHAHA